MKKNFLISLFVIAIFLLGFVSGKFHSLVMNPSYEGTYAKKHLQNEKRLFLLMLTDHSYQYSDPESDRNGKGSYEVIDDGIICFTSGDLEDELAVSNKIFMGDISMTVYDLDKDKKMELVKIKNRI